MHVSAKCQIGPHRFGNSNGTIGGGVFMLDPAIG